MSAIDEPGKRPGTITIPVHCECTLIRHFDNKWYFPWGFPAFKLGDGREEEVAEFRQKIASQIAWFFVEKGYTGPGPFP